MAEEITKDVGAFEDWELVCVCAHHSYQLLNLNDVEAAQLCKAIYGRSDGYGAEGFVPVQGYDWSGIRDSSDAAKKNMADVARDFLEAKGVLGLRYRKHP